MSPVEVIKRAQSLLGVRFRLHGRDPAHGVDCVGLVALAADCVALAPNGYRLRNTRSMEWEAYLDGAFVRCAEDLPGAILLMQAGPSQFHLGIWTGVSLIHSDARIGRVVETPAPLAWPLLSAWRVRG